jgi:hypothetical protein
MSRWHSARALRTSTISGAQGAKPNHLHGHNLQVTAGNDPVGREEWLAHQELKLQDKVEDAAGKGCP